MVEQSTNPIIFYGASYCGDCRRAKEHLDSLGCEYTYIDLEEHPEAAEKVMEINKGYQSIPTIIFPDGKVLIEPSNEELDEAINRLKKDNIIICPKLTETQRKS